MSRPGCVEGCVLGWVLGFEGRVGSGWNASDTVAPTAATKAPTVTTRFSLFMLLLSVRLRGIAMQGAIAA
jgi:hypothetical protein